MNIDDLESKVPFLVRKAFRRAFANARTSGYDVLTVAGGKVYRLKPNGAREFVIETGKPYPVTRGQIIKIK